MLLFLAIGWFLIQIKRDWKNKKEIKKALIVGLFLMVFDFIFENSVF
jgi:O-antigen ligase